MMIFLDFLLGNGTIYRAEVADVWNEVHETSEEISFSREKPTCLVLIIYENNNKRTKNVVWIINDDL